MSVNEVARPRVELNSQQAEEKLKELKKLARDAKKEFKDLTLKGDRTGAEAKKRELQGIEREMNKLKNQTLNTKTILQNLNTTSLKTLEKAARQLKSELKGMSQNTAEYVSKERDYKKLNTAIKKQYQSLNETGSAWGRMVSTANRYFGIVTLGAASLYGIIQGGSRVIMGVAALDDKFADVRKTTGLTSVEIQKLYGNLKKIDTRTANTSLLDLSRIAGKLGIEGVQNIEGFVRSADKISVALGEDLGGNVEDTINHIGKLVDLFKVKKEFGLEQGLLKVGSAINALGAASTASEEFIVEFTKRLGGTAKAAKFGIPDVMGLAATLDILGQTSEISTTAIQRMLIAIGQDVPKYARIANVPLEEFKNLLDKDVNDAFIKVLEGAQSTTDGLAGMTNVLKDLDIDAARAAAIASVLTQNIELLREQQALANDEFEKGTSLTNEFNIKNETLAARIDKLGKEWHKLITAKGIRDFSSDLITKTTSLIDWLKRNGQELKFLAKAVSVVVMAWLSYKLTVATLNSLTRTGILLKQLYAGAVGVLTGKIKLATIAQKSFNTATKLNPFGAIISILLAVGTAFLAFKNKVKEATAEQIKLNEAIAEGVAIMTSTLSVESRFKVIDKLTAIQLKKLNEQAQSELAILSEKEAKIKETYTASNNWIIQKIIELNNQKKATDDQTQKDIIDNQIFQYKRRLDALIKTEQGISATELDENKKRLQNVINVTNLKINELEKFGSSNKELTEDQIEALKKYKEALAEHELKRYRDSLSVRKQELFDVDQYYKKLYDLAKASGQDVTHLQQQHAEDRKTILDRQYKDYEAFLQKEMDASRDEDDENIREDPATSYSLKKFQESYNGRKLILNGFHESGLISTQEYNDQIYEIEKERVEKELALEEEKNKAKNSFLEASIKAATRLLSSAAQAQFNGEMKLLDKKYKTDQKALQGNFDKGLISKEKYDIEMDKLDTKRDERELLLKQKQAKREKVIAALEVGITTAKTIMKIKAIAAAYKASLLFPLAAAALAQIPWVLGEAALQLGMIAAEPLPQAYSGMYDVIGKQDGKSYSAPVVKNAGTGLLSGPTILAGELPEIIIDPVATRNLMINYPEAIDAIKKSAGIMPQFASGDYTKIPSTGKASTTTQQIIMDPDFKKSIDQFNTVVQRMIDEGVASNISMYHLNEAQKKYDAMEARVSKK